MPTSEQKAILENAADLLEESGHAGAQLLRELIRDKRLETLATFILYSGFFAGTRTEQGDVRLEVSFGEFTTWVDMDQEQLRADGVESILREIDAQIAELERQIRQRICERGENPLADCLAMLDQNISRVCPGCRSLVMPSNDQVSLTMTCNGCGHQMQVLPAENS